MRLLGRIRLNGDYVQKIDCTFRIALARCTQCQLILLDCRDNLGSRSLCLGKVRQRVICLTPCIENNFLKRKNCLPLLRLAKAQCSLKPSALKDRDGDIGTYLECARRPAKCITGTQAFCIEVARQGDIRVKARDGDPSLGGRNVQDCFRFAHVWTTTDQVSWEPNRNGKRRGWLGSSPFQLLFKDTGRLGEKHSDRIDEASLVCFDGWDERGDGSSLCLRIRYIQCRADAVIEPVL